MQGNLHYTCLRPCNFPLRNVCIETSKDIWYPHYELILRCTPTDPICIIRKWRHSRHSNKLVPIRCDSETEHSGHLLMSVRLLYNLSTYMNSTLLVSETDHIIWTVTFYPIFLEVYVKCVFRTSSKAADEVGNRTVTLR
jgi:hypothetical protein